MLDLKTFLMFLRHVPSDLLIGGKMDEEIYRNNQGCILVKGGG